MQIFYERDSPLCYVIMTSVTHSAKEDKYSVSRPCDRYAQ